MTDPVREAPAELVALEPVTVEAVAEIEKRNGELTLSWLIEGGINALVDGCVLTVSSRPLTDGYGVGDVYTADQLRAAIAAERAEIARLMSVVRNVNSRCDYLGIRIVEVIKERDALREQLACVRQALPEELRDSSVPSVAVATLTAGMEYAAQQLAEAVRDAARWSMLPAFFEEYQINAMKLYRDIDAAIDDKGEAK